MGVLFPALCLCDRPTQPQTFTNRSQMRLHENIGAEFTLWDFDDFGVCVSSRVKSFLWVIVVRERSGSKFRCHERPRTGEALDALLMVQLLENSRASRPCLGSNPD